MYCKDCKWWENKRCTNETKIGEDICWDDDENINQLSYSYNEGGCFSTGPYFGCVHFQSSGLKAATQQEKDYAINMLGSVDETKVHHFAGININEFTKDELIKILIIMNKTWLRSNGIINDDGVTR